MITPLHWRDLPSPVLSLLRQGSVIPAHPLALGPDRTFDKRSQRAISRYYVDAGSGGLAVGVHSTQFAIREVGLYEPVLRLAAETAREWTDETLVLVGGLSGKTAQAVNEAKLARGLGYHAVMLSLASMKVASIDEVLGAKWSPSSGSINQAVVPPMGLPSESAQPNAVPPHSWTSMPRWRLYQAWSVGASFALKKMPPTPVTRFM